jgi:hypothetical protein
LERKGRQGRDVEQPGEQRGRRWGRAKDSPREMNSERRENEGILALCSTRCPATSFLCVLKQSPRKTTLFHKASIRSEFGVQNRPGYISDTHVKTYRL